MCSVCSVQASKIFSLTLLFEQRYPLFRIRNESKEFERNELLLIEFHVNE